MSVVAGRYLLKEIFAQEHSVWNREAGLDWLSTPFALAQNATNFAAHASGLKTDDKRSLVLTPFTHACYEQGLCVGYIGQEGTV